jgi:hypothetical protein
MTPRMRIVWQVIRGALDCEDEIVVAACRRLIMADHVGWQKHHDPRDWQLVRAFAGISEA